MGVKPRHSNGLLLLPGDEDDDDDDDLDGPTGKRAADDDDDDEEVRVFYPQPHDESLKAVGSPGR